MNSTDPARFVDPLVEPAWLADRIGKVAIIDATYALNGTSTDRRETFDRSHIPTARFFDIDIVADLRSALPHMMPSAAAFADAMGEIGIGNDDAVVVYDRSQNHFSAPRVWWTLRHFGHRNVAVLNGGLARWAGLGLPVESGTSGTERRRYLMNVASSDMIASIDDVRRTAASGPHAARIIDARSRDRFDGTAQEPRPGLRSGHIPGSVSLPFDELTQSDGAFVSPAQVRHKLQQLGIDECQPVITTCGSGLTACVVALGLARAGHVTVSVYDGAWAEWGGRDDTPVESAHA